MKPFTYSNGGPHVPLHGITAVSGEEMMHNETKYPDALTFNGLRFVNTGATKPTDSGSMTEVSKDYVLWGLGSLAWQVS